ncbi:MAG: hypothetical protein IT435_16970 [Phycisphaerales bacterium]|nr:hypothetical protein [Phycisphaerales bacterium]
MLTGPWCKGRDTNAITDCFVAMVDYRNKNEDPELDALGGFLVLARATRDDDTSDWDPPTAQVVYEATFPDFDGGADSDHRIDDGIHTHSGSVLFTGETGMIVTISIGDGRPNNRLVTLARSNFADFDDGQAKEPEPPSPSDPGDGSTYPPPYETQNGWTTYEDREGQRRRIRFTDAAWIASAKTLQHEAFTRYIHTIDWPIEITDGNSGNGSGVVLIKGKTADDTLLLNRAINSANASVDGQVYCGSSSQIIGQAPLSDDDAILLGSDESITMLLRTTITDAEDRILPEVVYGMPTEIRRGTGGQDDILNWNCFLIYCALPRKGEHYAAIVEGGNIGGWQDLRNASSLLYSKDGETWSQAFALQDNAHPTCAFYGTSHLIFPLRKIGGQATEHVALAKIPVPAIIKARPISISPGGTNILRASGWDSENLEEIFVGANIPQFSNNLSPVDRSDLATMFNHPVAAPPCFGPIFRVRMTESSYLGVLKIASGIAEGEQLRLRYFVHLLQPPLAPSGDPTSEDIENSAVAGALRWTFGYGDFYSGTKTRPADNRAIGGTGWIPITHFIDTADFSPGSWPVDLVAEVVGASTQFIRQDFLIAMDYIVRDGGEDARPECPVQPLQWPEGINPTVEDQLTISGLSCGSNWTIYAGGRIPDFGADYFSGQNGLPDNPAFTLWQSNSSFIKVFIDRYTADPADGTAVRFKDHNGDQIVVRMPSGLPTNFEQPFFPLRGRQFLIGISKIGTGSNNYRVWVSIGGTVVAVATGTLANVQPGKIKTGDENNENPDGLDYFGFAVDSTTATSEADGKTALQTLSFLL